MFGHILNRVNF